METNSSVLTLSSEKHFLASLLKAKGDGIDSILQLGIGEENFFDQQTKLVAQAALGAIYEASSEGLNPSILKTLIVRTPSFKAVFRSEKDLDIYLGKLYSVDVSGSETLEALAENLIRTTNENNFKYLYQKHLSEGTILTPESSKELREALDKTTLVKSESVFTTVYDHCLKTMEEDEEKIRKVDEGLDIDDFLATSFPTIDKIIGGLAKSDFLVIGARPSVGKTTFVLNIMANVANKYPGKQLVIFSMEMKATQIMNKIICLEMKCPYPRIDPNETKEVLKESIQAFLRVKKEYLKRGKGRNIHISEGANITVHEVAALCFKKNLELKSEQKETLSVVIVDHIGLLAPTKFNSTELMKLTEATRRLKTLAIDLDATIIGLSQVNRDIDKRQAKDKNAILEMSDLRDSGTIEQDANIIMFLNPSEDRRSVFVDVKKNRLLSRGSVYLSFNAVCGEFKEDGPILKTTMPKDQAEKAMFHAKKVFSSGYTKEPEFDFTADRPF